MTHFKRRETLKKKERNIRKMSSLKARIQMVISKMHLTQILMRVMMVGQAKPLNNKVIAVQIFELYKMLI